MRKRLLILVICVCPIFASAQPAPSLDNQLGDWNALPEDPAMQQACSNELSYGSAIADARSKGATTVMLLRRAEQESKKTATQVPTDPVLPVGTELILMKLIQHSIWDVPIYSKIPGGFPQWAYRSCLKGRSLDQ